MACFAWLQERTDLCRALLYAVVLSPAPLKPGSLVDILFLLEHLVSKVKAAGTTQHVCLSQQQHLVKCTAEDVALLMRMQIDVLSSCGKSVAVTAPHWQC